MTLLRLKFLTFALLLPARLKAKKMVGSKFTKLQPSLKAYTLIPINKHKQFGIIYIDNTSRDYAIYLLLKSVTLYLMMLA